MKSSLEEANYPLSDWDEEGYASESEEIALDDSVFVGMTGAQIFHELMIHHEVEQIFGYPGGGLQVRPRAV